jgi:hypothetical protein
MCASCDEVKKELTFTKIPNYFPYNSKFVALSIAIA